MGWRSPAGAGVTLDVTGTLVGPLHTVRIIATVTAELENSTPEAASAVIGRTLAVATGKTMDATVFGTAAGDELKPAGLLHGLTPISPATPGELTPIATDLGNLAGAIADAGIEADDLVLVTNPRQAIQLRLLAGPAFTHLVLGTTVVPSRTVIAIAPSAVAVGFSGVPSIKTSKETVLHYESETPAAIAPPGGPISAPTRSLWQHDAIAIQVRTKATWSIVAPGAVAFVQDVAWGS
jgi:hypothetical protein